MPCTNPSSNTNENNNLTPGHSADGNATPPIPPSSSNAAGNPTLFSDNTATNEVEQQYGSEIETTSSTSPNAHVACQEPDIWTVEMVYESIRRNNGKDGLPKNFSLEYPLPFAADTEFPKRKNNGPTEPSTSVFLLRQQLSGFINLVVSNRPEEEDRRPVQQRHISTLSGVVGKKLTAAQKVPYEERASVLREEFEILHPGVAYKKIRALKAAAARKLNAKSRLSPKMSAKWKGKGKGKGNGDLKKVQSPRIPFTPLFRLDEKTIMALEGVRLTCVMAESRRHHAEAAATQNSFSYASRSGSATSSSSASGSGSSSFPYASGLGPSTHNQTALASGSGNFSSNVTPSTWGNIAQPAFIPQDSTGFNIAAQPMPHYSAQPQAFDGNYASTSNIPEPSFNAWQGHQHIDLGLDLPISEVHDYIVNQGNAPGSGVHAGANLLDAQAGSIMYSDTAMFVPMNIHGSHTPAMAGVSSSAEQHPQARNQPTQFGLNASGTYVSSWGATYSAEQYHRALREALSLRLDCSVVWVLEFLLSTEGPEAIMASPLSAEFNNFLNWET